MTTSMDPLTASFLACLAEGRAGKAGAKPGAPRRTDDDGDTVRDPARLASSAPHHPGPGGAGLLITHLALGLKYTVTFLSGVEKGGGPTRMRTYRKIALALGLSLEAADRPGVNRPTRAHARTGRAHPGPHGGAHTQRSQRWPTTQWSTWTRGMRRPDEPVSGGRCCGETPLPEARCRPSWRGPATTRLPPAAGDPGSWW
jgi:hypothetical protein